MKRHLLALAAALTLSACGTADLLKSTEPRQTIYSLRPVQEESIAPNGPAVIVEISKPSLPPGFETDRVALYLNGGRSLDYYSGAKWPDVLDSVVQDFTRRSASKALPYIVAVEANDSSDADFRLQTKLNEFQPVYDAGATATPMLMVGMEFTLVSLPEEKIVTSFVLSKNMRADSNELSTIVTGLSTMLGAVQTDAYKKLDPRLKAVPRS